MHVKASPEKSFDTKQPKANIYKYSNSFQPEAAKKE